MIIGLTGSFCSGKDSIADYLNKKGFIHFSLSDMIREECKRIHIEPTRENLQKVGTKLREEYGNSILAKRALEQILEDSNYVITSIRHPIEVKTLEKRRGFFFMRVDAPIELRFERMLSRDRAGDPKTLSEFRKAERLEMKGKGSGQSLEECYKLAKFHITNDSNLEDLHHKVDVLVNYFRKELRSNRRDKDEYYLNIARAVGQRGTCLRRRFGAVIVNHDQIISTGYAGAARGAKNCIDIKTCPRQKAGIPAGQRYELCRSVHAEMNAIIHADRTDMIGGTLYLYGEDLEKDGALMEDVRPCKMCARFIVNAGLDQVVVMSSSGIKKYPVENFIKNEDLDLRNIKGGY